MAGRVPRRLLGKIEIQTGEIRGEPLMCGGGILPYVLAHRTSTLEQISGLTHSRMFAADLSCPSWIRAEGPAEKQRPDNSLRALPLLGSTRTLLIQRGRHNQPNSRTCS
jgi:hypothetical protein